MSTGSITLPVAAARLLTRCRICGFSEIRTDEVVDRAPLLVAECPRCEHRFTRRAAPAGQRVAVACGHGERHEEAASAA